MVAHVRPVALGFTETGNQRIRPSHQQRSEPITVQTQKPMLPIAVPDQGLRAFCQRHGIARLALFGSVLRDDFGPASDVDVLVEFLPGRGAGLIAFAGMELELGELLGRRVDLNTAGFLSPYFVDTVAREALPLYVAA